MNNAYHIFEEIRDNVNEEEASHWSDLEILRKIIRSHRMIDMILMQNLGDWNLVSELLTPVASIVTLPSNCAKPVYMEEVSSGYEIPITGSIRNRRITRLPGTTLEGTLGIDAYLLKDSIEINQDSFTNQVRLWYYKRRPDPHFGTGGSSSGALALQLDVDKNPRNLDDYYNDIDVEIIDGTGEYTIDTISDYDGGTHIAVVTGTYANDSVYGTIIDLPEEALEYLIMDATIMLMTKPSSSLSEVVFQYMLQRHKQVKAAFEEWIATRLVNRVGVETTEIID